MKRIGILVLLILIISTVYSVDNIYFDADRASNYLGIPSPYTSEVNNEIVHPDVIYEPEGWNGYKYWMVFTPFPNSEPQYENPCIVVSQDGLTWSVPTGLTNPVVAVDLIPANYDYQYYSDPDFILSSDKATMYLSWRYKHGWVDEELLVITSTDGINWSTETLVLSTNENFEKLISPAIIYNDAQYELFTVNSTVSPRKYYRRTAGTPLGPWVNRTELNFALYNGESWILSDQVAGASMVWHWNMIYEEGEYWMIGAVGPATTSSGGSLWIAKSTDGLNWVFDNNPLFDIGTS
ncbi:MAG: hypothetical protein P9L91_07750, partial [Candidatus Zophobacter franzmannii]|nr:hypothetical protein [Candidatus Zophobacter franzmannii]